MATEGNERSRHRRSAARASVVPAAGGRTRVAGQRSRSREASDAVDETAHDTQTAEATRQGGAGGPRLRLPGRPSLRSGSRRMWLTVSAVLLVVFAGIAAVLGLRVYDGRTSDTNAAAVLRIVPRYASQVLSFDYRQLDRNSAAARPLLSGAYRKDYDQSMTSHAAAWKKYHYVVKSSIASAGVSRASGSEVVVVAFVDQSVSAGTTKIGTAKDLIRLRLTLRRQNGTWLLTKLDSL